MGHIFVKNGMSPEKGRTEAICSMLYPNGKKGTTTIFRHGHLSFQLYSKSIFRNRVPVSINYESFLVALGGES